MRGFLLLFIELDDILTLHRFFFGVSFVLALAVALRAREVRTKTLRIVVAVFKQFFSSPLSFVFPPASDDVPRAEHHH